MKKILIVDDDPVILNLISGRLRKEGYQTYLATNGVEAYALAMIQKFDLMVLDIMMPIMDGYKFIKEIKGNSEIDDTPILIMSAYSQTKVLFEEERIVNFLTKPFDAQKLLNNVALCLQG